MSSYLLVSDRVYPNPSSNGNCVRNIAEELVKQNHKVVVLSLFDSCPQKKLSYKNVDYYFAGYNEKKYSIDLYHKIFSFYEDKNAVNRLIKLGEIIIRERVIDTVISFYKPIDTIIFGYYFSKKNKLSFIPVFYDIPVTNAEQGIKRKYLSFQFKRLISSLMKFGKVYYLKYNEKYYTNELKVKSSLVPVSVPNINRIECTMHYSKSNHSKKIVYSGSFWPTIRNPEKMLDLLKFIKDYDVEIHLYSWGCDEILEKYKKIYGKSLILHGRCSSDVIQQAYNEADILLNLSNNTDYQVPGKIFEYFSTGKPIINFIFRDNDPAIEEYSKYPSIYTHLLGDRVNQKEIIDFLFDTTTHIIDYNIIEKLYYDSTAKRFVDLIC